MNLSLTNTGTFAVPIIEPTPDNFLRGRLGRDQREGWIEVLQPNIPLAVNEGFTVAIIGVKPSVRDQFERAYEVLNASAKALLEAYQNRTLPNMPTDDTPIITVMIHNLGTNAVRVILGDGVTDVNVAPGTTYAGTAKGYLELRELGHVNPNIERQPSSAA